MSTCFYVNICIMFGQGTSCTFIISFILLCRPIIRPHAAKPGRDDLVVKASDSGSRGRGFDSHAGRRVVSSSKTHYSAKVLVIMERLYCLLVTAFMLLSQLLVISCAFFIILDAVDILLCMHTILSQANAIVACAFNIIMDAVDILLCIHTVIL